MHPNGPTDFGIGKNIAGFTDSIGGCGMSFTDTAARGYAYKVDDARDMEIKAWITFKDIDPGNGFSISARTGHHQSNGTCCQGFSYMFNVDPNTNPMQMRFRKEMWHVSYHNSPEGWFTHPAANFNIDGKKVGLGFVIYNKPGTTDRVVLEGWFNPDPVANKENWIMMKRIEDFPGNGWGDDGDQCDGEPDQVGTWSNAQNRWKTNSTGGSVTFEGVSTREIDPSRALDDTGGTPTTPPPPPPQGGGTTPLEINPIITYGCAANKDPLSLASQGFTGVMRLTRLIADQVISAMINPDPFSRFGSAGWRRNTTDDFDIQQGICATGVENNKIYADGLGVQTYWSNADNRCVGPGSISDGTAGTNADDVVNHSGRIMKNPVINLIFWNGNPGITDWATRTESPTMADVITDVKDKLLGTDKAYFDGIQQYGAPGYPVWGTSVVNSTYQLTASADTAMWTKENAEKVIIDCLKRGQLPGRDVDFLNQLYIIIGPVGIPFRDITQPPESTGSTEGPNAPGTRDTNISLTMDLVFPTSLTGSGLNSRKQFDIALSEEMIEIQADAFPDTVGLGWAGTSLGDDAIRELGDTPCDYAMGTEGNQPYADGLQVEAYWSNSNHDCVIDSLTSGGTGEHEDDIPYHGGPVMKHPKIYLIFWGDDWVTRTSQPTKNQCIQDCRDKLLGTDSNYFNFMGQYSGCGVPVWGGAVQNNITPVVTPEEFLDPPTLDNRLEQVIADTINAGFISLSNTDFTNTQFIIIPEYPVLNNMSNSQLNDIDFGAFHYDYTASITFPPLEPGQVPSTPTQTFPEVGGRHDVFKPTILLPGTAGTGTGGGTLPPDTTIPPPGASVITPIVSWAVVQVIDPTLSLIHASLPDWDGNNTVTRPLAAALIQSQVNTDQFGRFGPPGWSRDTGTNNQISEAPCSSSSTVDNVHIYGDGLGVQTYWSNLANNCVVPGRGDPDLGTSTDVKNHGGKTMIDPLVVLIFWGPDWLTRTDAPSVTSITAEVKEKLLDNDSVFFSQLNQYGGVGTPQFGASVINTSVPIPSDLETGFHETTLNQAMAVVKSTLQNGSLPTALIDFDNTWFCVIPAYQSDVHDFSGAEQGLWNDVFQPTIILPGEAPEDPGGSPDPNDLQTFSGVLSFKRDINLIRTSSCAGTEVVVPPPDPGDPPVDPPIGGTAIFYKVSSTSNQKEISNESSSSNRTQITEKINSSSSAMNGKLLKQADVVLKKETGTTDVTPLVYFKIWDTTGAVIYTSPTTFTPNSLSTSFEAKVFDCSTNTHTLVVGDRVGCEFTGTDPDQFVWTAYATSDSGNTGSSGSYSVYKEGSSYDSQTSRRCSFTLWT